MLLPKERDIGQNCKGPIERILTARAWINPIQRMGDSLMKELLKTVPEISLDAL
jgi:hypothetical protein